MKNDDSEQAANIKWSDKIFPVVMAISIAASSWFLNQAWTKITTLEGKVQTIEVSLASTSGSRFTSADWSTAKSIIDSDRNSLDRRVMRLEESLPVIKDTLIDIKAIIHGNK